MLRQLEDLTGFSIMATDDSVGTVKDILFDDQKWAVRNLVVGTGGLLGGKSVLVSPICVDRIDAEARILQLSLSREEVEGAPPLESAAPVSRQFEVQYYDHYRWPYYWAGPYTWGLWAAPALMRSDLPREVEEMRERQMEDRDPHLRSFNKVNGYKVEARDGVMGDIEDMIFDDETWRIRYLVVDTAKFLPSKDVLVPPQAAKRISFPESSVHLDMTKAELSNRPEFRSVDEISDGGAEDIVIVNKG